MPLKPFEIPSRDLDDFSRLTEQESHSIEGQILKMEMIERMVRDRFDEHASEVEKQLRNDGLKDEAFETAFQARAQNIRVRHLELGDGRVNLIVEKGDGDDETPDPLLYRVMIPAHIDTVEPSARTELETDLRNPDRLTGLGVYDMGQGVLNSIALTAEARVPPGMKVYFVFTVDEEKDSRGARALIKEWEMWPHIDCVLSSEIGPLPPLLENDDTMRLITARAGRVKFITNITVDPRHQGHGAIDDLPNAGDALFELHQRLSDRFYKGYDGNVESIEPPQMRTHQLLGKEKIETGPYLADQTRGGYIPTDVARFEFSVRMLPPSTIQEYVELFRRWGKGIAKRGRWDEFGIRHTLALNSNKASYSPYEMPSDHPLVKISSYILLRVSGVLPELAGAPSVADECDFAADMLSRQAAARQGNESQESPWSFMNSDKGIINIPVNGGDAHNVREWVSKRSIMQVREAYRLLIEEDEGFLLMYKARREKAAGNT